MTPCLICALFSVPYDRNRLGIYITGRFANISGVNEDSTYPIYLNFDQRNQLYLNAAEDAPDDVDEYQGEVEELSNHRVFFMLSDRASIGEVVSSVSTSIMRIDMPAQYPSAVDTADLGIGVGSDLLNETGSIAFIPRSAHNGDVLLGASAVDFADNFCRSDSMFQAPIVSIVAPIYRDGLWMRFSLLNPSGDRFMETRSHIGIHQPVQVRLETSTFDIPNELNILIRSMIPELASADLGRYLFRNCNHVRSQLPIVVSRIYRNGTDSSLAGTLLIYPEDYTRLSRNEHDQCELLVKGDQYGHSFDPFMLGDVNTFISGTSITFCDSLPLNH